MKKEEIPYHVFTGTFMGLASSYTDLLKHSRDPEGFRRRICERLVEIAAECTATIDAHDAGRETKEA